MTEQQLGAGRLEPFSDEEYDNMTVRLTDRSPCASGPVSKLRPPLLRRKAGASCGRTRGRVGRSPTITAEPL